MSAARRDQLVLLLVALAVNALAALFIATPGYMDAAYYYGGALRLVGGHGLTEPYLWNYLFGSSALPVPGFGYWMPLTSFAAAAAMALFGESFRTAQIPFVLVASALPVVAHRVGARAGLDREARIVAGLLVVFGGFFTIFWADTDSFALFGLVGALALVSIARATETGRARWFAGAGALVGLAHLARADGVLLLVVVLGGLLFSHKSEQLLKLGASVPKARQLDLTAARAGRRLVQSTRLGDGETQSPQSDTLVRREKTRLADKENLSVLGVSPVTPATGRGAVRYPSAHWRRHALAAVTAGYLLVMAPWFARNVAVVGSPLPPGGLRTIWLTQYDDLFLYPASEITAARFFAQGAGEIVRGKLWALGQNLQTLVAVQGMVYLGPFVALGLWQLRRDALFRVVAGYGLLLFGVMTFVFTFPGARGGLFHSGAALVPLLAPAGVYGIDCAVGWVAARREQWNARHARRVFRLGVVGLAGLLTAALFGTRVLASDWSHFDRLFAEVGAQLPADSIVASNNPPGLYVASDHAGVMIPAGDPEMLAQVVQRFGVDYVLLDANHVAALEPLYAGRVLPSFLCPPSEPADGVFFFAVAPCR